jgi:hypothetical protein
VKYLQRCCKDYYSLTAKSTGAIASIGYAWWAWSAVKLSTARLDRERVLKRDAVLCIVTQGDKMYLENRDTKYKKVGNKHYVEFYEDNTMIGVIDYSKHSMHYVEDAIENFCNGSMTKETIERFNINGKNQ